MWKEQVSLAVAVVGGPYRTSCTALEYAIPETQMWMKPPELGYVAALGVLAMNLLNVLPNRFKHLEDRLHIPHKA